MIMNRTIGIIVVLLLTIGISYAQSPISLAEKEYKVGNYKASIEIYEHLLNEKGGSAALYANLGNAYTKIGDYGKAVVAYERALQMDPSSKIVNNNLLYLQSRIEDNNKADAKGGKLSVVPDELSFFTNLKKTVIYNHSSNTWAIVAAGSFILCCICIALYLFRQEVIIRKIGFFAGILLFILSFSFLAFAYSVKDSVNRKDYGVIVGFKVPLLAEPYNSSKVVSSPLNKGTKLFILSQEMSNGTHERWYKVRLNSDYVGWIKGSELEII